MTKKSFYDIIIVGAGCAGMTAAVYARRAGKSVLILECESFGGQISYAPKVENFPSVKSISGAEFSDNLYEQATSNGADAELDRVVKVSRSNDIIEVTTEYGRYDCTALIIATGLKHRKLGIEKELQYIGHGISFCAVCDGVFYKDADVAVCGGGNTAVSDAIYLSEICKSVTLVHRRAEFRAESGLVEQAKGIENIRFELESTIDELVGDDVLGAVKIKKSNGEEKTLQVDGLFLAVGQIPSNEEYKSLVKLDESGFILAGEDCKTSAKGVFAAGDCRTKAVRQLTTAAADGAVAAIEACAYVDAMKRK